MSKNDSKEKSGNWFKRHKVLSVILAFVALFVLVGTLGGDSTKNGSNGASKDAKAKTYRFADRADKQKEDVEIAVGESGSIQGLKLTVNSAEYKTSVGEYDNAKSGNTYVVVNVTLTNTDKSTHPYNPYDFRVQTTGGQVLDPTIVMANDLDSGDLVTGGTVTGDIYFEIPATEGHEYLIWKPSGLDAARVIVELK